VPNTKNHRGTWKTAPNEERSKQSCASTDLFEQLVLLLMQQHTSQCTIQIVLLLYSRFQNNITSQMWP